MIKAILGISFISVAIAMTSVSASAAMMHHKKAHHGKMMHHGRMMHHKMMHHGKAM